MNIALVQFSKRLKRVVYIALLAGLAGGPFGGAAHAGDGLSTNALQQIQALLAEKESRSPAQQKMDSQLVYALKLSRNQPVAEGVVLQEVGVKTNAAGLVSVDINAAVTPQLLALITQSGGTVTSAYAQFGTLRAEIPLALAETLAGRAEVKFIQPAVGSFRNVGILNSQGDRTHRADEARTVFGVDGSGVSVGVISDSVDFLGQSQSTGDLPPDVTVLPGQSGVPGSGEGTAMLEIVHDLAPGAKLYFATAFGSPAGFAQNILDLQAAGCSIIVDDVGYFNESPFQDDLISRAVNQVTASGALYFSSAANSGNLKHGTSGTWEGDFVDGGPAGTPVNGRGGNLHSFGANTYNTITQRGTANTLQWSDPLGASTNDYDLFVLDANGSAVLAASTTIQNGTQDPYEIIGGSATGVRLVVVKVSGVGRFLHLDTIRGELEIGTAGNTKGHATATNAFGVAATDANFAYPNPFPGGPASPVEDFSSDGYRRVFYDETGVAITPGDFSATGGFVRLKPDITAADGVSTTVPGFNPFYGTSAAAPHAAAIAALIRSFNLTLTPAQIRPILMNTALDIENNGFDDAAGAGIVMAYPALAITPPPGLVMVTNYFTGGNGNGVIDYNECLDYFVVLTNRSLTSASHVEVTLFSSTPGVSFGVKRLTYPDMPPGGGGVNFTPFKLSTAPNFVCGTPIVLGVLVKSDQVTSSNVVVLSSGTVLSPTRYDVSGPVSIPDNSAVGINSLVVVSNVPSVVTKVAVSVNISHTYVWDLKLELIGPDGTVVPLSVNHGGSGQNYGLACAPDSLRTTFDDAAAIGIGAANPPYAGSFRPDSSLSVFAGKSGTNVNGTWQLHIVDSAAPDAGTLQCWSLFLYPAGCVDGGGTCSGADLSLGMTAQPEPVFIGSNLFYTLTVTNSGPSSAKSTVLTQVLPGSVVPVSAVASQGSCSFAGNTMVGNLGTVGIGQVVTVLVTATPALAGVASSSASVTSAESDPDPSNNSASVLSHVNPATADITVGILDAPDPALLGGVVTYTVTVTNRGPSSASGVTLTNTLSAGLVVQSAVASQGNAVISGNVVGCNLVNLTNGGRATVTITAVPVVEGAVSATAVAGALQADPVTGNNTAIATTIVGPAANLGLTLVAVPTTAVVRSNWTYFLTVTNAGPSAANAVVINATLAGTITVVATNASQGTVSVVGGTVTANLGTLGVGAGATVSIVANATNSGLYAANATVASLAPDPDLGNNAASASVTVAPPNVSIVTAGATLTAESVAPANGALDVGETVTVQLRLRNAGNVNNTNLTATLLAGGGVTSPSPASPVAYGVLPPGGQPVGQPFTFTVSGTNGGSVTATLQIADGGNNLGTVSYNFSLPVVRTFANTNRISITDNQPVPWPAGPATPYPSTNLVSGVSGLVGKVTVTLSNLSHSYPDDIDMLLVGPGGQKVILMSDVGGSDLITNVTVTLDDGAASVLPDGGQLLSTSYRPADYEAGDPFNAPAPAGPYATTLSSFAGLNPNGTWSLYIMDDTLGDPGSVGKGWSLAITTVSPVNQLADLGLTAVAVPGPALVAGNITCTYTITNSGPNPATGVGFTNTVPASALLVGATASQGSVVTNGNTVTASLGTLNVGAVATVTVVIKPLGGGILNNPGSVGASEVDLNPANNTANAAATVSVPVADLGLSQTLSNGLSGDVVLVLTVTNNGPQPALNVLVTDPLPAGFAFVGTSAVNYTNTGGIITFGLGNIVAGGSSTFTVTISGSGSKTNTASVSTTSSDGNAANNSATVVIAPGVVTAGAVLTVESGPVNAAVDPGETVTLAFGLQNVGTADAGNLVATLQSSGGVTPITTSQNYGVLTHGGAAVTRSYSFTANGANGGVVVATLQLQDGADNLGTVAFAFHLPTTATFSNPAAILIPDHGGANPYPSTITFSGLTGLVSAASVTLAGFTHGFPDDVDVLLVGPAGQKLVVLSDAGGGHSVSNLVLTFADGNSTASDSTQLSGGTYAPTDYETGDIFLAPAPAGEPGSAFSAFNGSDPNGTWSLYVVDDATGDAGLIGSGWSLTLTTLNVVNPVADLGITLTDAPDPVLVGNALTYTIGVTNAGPVGATGVIVTDVLPAGVIYISGTSSQGTVTNSGNTVSGVLGSIASGSGAGVTIRVAATAGGTVANSVSVAGVETDLNNGNNTASVTTSALIPVIATLTDAGVTNGQLSFTLTGEPSQAYVIQASTDLTIWTPIATNATAVDGILKFTDPNVPAYTNRFYRAIRVVQ